MRTLDITALRSELRQIAAELKEAKKLRKLPPGMGPPFVLKEQATYLCALRAGHRGKVHLHGMSFEDQQKMLAATNLYLRFALKIQPEATVA